MCESLCTPLLPTEKVHKAAKGHDAEAGPGAVCSAADLRAPVCQELRLVQPLLVKAQIYVHAPFQTEHIPGIQQDQEIDPKEGDGGGG